jgi:flagellar biosynthetic protein FliS
MSTKGADQYLKNYHNTASKEHLVLRVFEKAITEMWEIRDLLQSEDKVVSIEKFHLVRRLFLELQSSLDDDGGDISGHLFQLYTYILRELSTAGFDGDIQSLENAIAVAEQLYEGFFEAFTVDSQT